MSQFSPTPFGPGLNPTDISQVANDNFYRVSNSVNNIDNTNLSTLPEGFGGAWKSWTPTWTNLTVGNGTGVYKYTQIGKTIVARFSFTFGSTSAMGSNPTLTLPVAPNSSYINTNQRTYLSGDLHIEDNLTAGYNGWIRFQGSPVVLAIGVYSASGTYTGLQGMSATIPMTWTTGDFFYGQVTYEAA
jgi:hypothetical protein